MTSPPKILRSAVLVGHGHPAIRATHSKTFEFTAEPDITARATCVLAVGTRLDPSLALLRGPVQLTLSTDGLPAVHGSAIINPAHEVTDRVVIRRSEAQDPDTWAIGSTLTADDLPADFAAALAEPDRAITLTVEEFGHRRPLVVVGTETRGIGADTLLAFGSADIKHSTAPGRPAKLGADALAVLTEGGIAAVALPSLTMPTPAAADFLTRAAILGARFRVLPRAQGPQKPLEALLASGLPLAPYTWLATPQRLSTLPETPTVFRMPETAFEVAFADREVWIEDTSERDLGTAMRHVSVQEAIASPGTLTVVAPAEAEAETADLLAVAQALIEAGIPPRTVTEALAPFGLTRRKLYSLLKESE